MHQKLTGWLLLCLIVAQALLIPLTLSLRQLSVYYRMQELKYHLHQSVSFSFSKSQLKAHQINDDELLIDGKMYDIVQLIPSKGSYNIIAVHDQEEDHIIKELVRFFGRKAHQAKWNMINFQLYCAANFYSRINPEISWIYTTLAETSATSLPCIVIKLTAPPPEVI
jgi:hypothetical protein